MQLAALRCAALHSSGAHLGGRHAPPSISDLLITSLTPSVFLFAIIFVLAAADAQRRDALLQDLALRAADGSERSAHRREQRARRSQDATLVEWNTGSPRGPRELLEPTL